MRDTHPAIHRNGSWESCCIDPRDQGIMISTLDGEFVEGHGAQTVLTISIRKISCIRKRTDG